MNVADLRNARKFMERLNAWFYGSYDREVKCANEVVNNLNFLSGCVQSSSLCEENLSLLYDVSNILMQHVMESDKICSSQVPPCINISQSCNNINEIGTKKLKNEPLLLSASKYKSLDTLAGCFTSVQTAGSLVQSRTNLSFAGINSRYENTAEQILGDSPNNVDPPYTVTRTNTAPDFHRESSWEQGLNTIAATSSPVGSITDGLDFLNLDEVEGQVILKICNETKTNMDRIERLLKKSLNRTHNLSKTSTANVSTCSIPSKRKLALPSPQITRGSVGRFSLGAARLPVPPKKNVPTPKPIASTKQIIRPKATNLGATVVLQSAGRNIITAKRKISSLSTLRDLATQNNTKLKLNGKLNSTSSIPSLRNSFASKSPKPLSRIDK